MKLLKALVIVLIVLGVGWFFWNRLPGMRARISGAVDQYGGWTEEARRKDPVGFIEHAQKQLAEDLEAFRQSREDLTAAKVKAEAEMDRNEALFASAVALADEFRAAWQGAEAQGAWPVSVAGKGYGREELIEQVRLVLLQKQNYRDIVTSFEEVLETVGTREADLFNRINTTKATLTTLDAQKELVRIQQLTEKTDELLRKVGELLGDNEEVRSELDSPVRTVEELLASGGDEQPRQGDVDVLDFLEGR